MSDPGPSQKRKRTDETDKTVIRDFYVHKFEELATRLKAVLESAKHLSKPDPSTQAHSSQAHSSQAHSSQAHSSQAHSSQAHSCSHVNHTHTHTEEQIHNWYSREKPHTQFEAESTAFCRLVHNMNELEQLVKDWSCRAVIRKLNEIVPASICHGKLLEVVDLLFQVKEEIEKLGGAQQHLILHYGKPPTNPDAVLTDTGKTQGQKWLERRFLPNIQLECEHHPQRYISNPSDDEEERKSVEEARQQRHNERHNERQTQKRIRDSVKHGTWYWN